MQYDVHLVDDFEHLENGYLAAKIDIDPAEKGPLQICQKLEKEVRALSSALQGRPSVPRTGRGGRVTGARMVGWTAGCVLLEFTWSGTSI